MQRNVETAHRERSVSLSVALVPYRGDTHTQHRNLALLQQQITNTREGALPRSEAHVQYRGDTQRPRLAMQQQEQEAGDPEREVHHLKVIFYLES